MLTVSPCYRGRRYGCLRSAAWMFSYEPLHIEPYKEPTIMGRTIKLLLYYFAYQLAFNGVFICSYMIYNHTTEVPGISDGPYFNLLLWASVLATVAIGIHLLAGKYTSVHPVRWNTPQTIKIGLSSIVLVTGMGLWTNYLNELADLPNNFQEMFDKMMHHPLGIVSIVILAPLVEELLFRGSIQGHLLRKWKNPVWAILFSSLIFGAVHGNPVQIPFAFVLGTALGWMYYRTGSLLPSILMHFVNNGTAVCTFLIAEDPQATLISTYGTGGAAGIAVLGVVLTVVSIGYIVRQIPQTPVWKEPAPMP